MINSKEILETIRMIQDECLDIRTTTMGISLLDCGDTDIDKIMSKKYMTKSAKRLSILYQPVSRLKRNTVFLLLTKESALLRLQLWQASAAVTLLNTL